MVKIEWYRNSDAPIPEYYSKGSDYLYRLWKPRGSSAWSVKNQSTNTFIGFTEGLGSAKLLAAKDAAASHTLRPAIDGRD